MKNSNTAADFIACAAILIAVISGSLNLHLWSEVNRYQNISQKQAEKIQTMERTLLMSR
ncbi:MAG TPA: hypothetical protein V6D48_22900 [Oculatellaceae cyanobacterium]